jgi:hypothetical protein
MATAMVAVIFGEKGGPSSTFVSKALLIHRWSSTLLEGQLVCPRSFGCSQRIDLVVGVELSSLLLSEFGGNAWSSPAFGGRGVLVLACFFFFSFRVLFVKLKASYSNNRFFRVSDEKGPSCKMYLPRLHQ